MIAPRPGSHAKSESLIQAIQSVTWDRTDLAELEADVPNRLCTLENRLIHNDGWRVHKNRAVQHAWRPWEEQAYDVNFSIF